MLLPFGRFRRFPCACKVSGRQINKAKKQVIEAYFIGSPDERNQVMIASRRFQFSLQRLPAIVAFGFVAIVSF
jgi:hypothetical protein